MTEEQPMKKEVGVETGEKESPLDVESAVEEKIGEAERQNNDIQMTGEKISDITKEENLPPAKTGEILMENKDIQGQANKTTGEFKTGVKTIIEDSANEQSQEVDNQKPKPENQQESEKSEEDLKIFEDLGKEMKAGEKEYKDETERRLKEWEEKSDEEKKKEIEDFTKEKLESDPAIKEIMNDNEKLREYIKNISEERKKLLEAKSEAAKKIEELLRGEVDFSKLRPEDRMAAKEVLRELLKSSRLELSSRKADYCLEKIESMENLMKNHESREINIEALEKMIKTAEDAEVYLAQLERLTEEEKEEVEEEIKGLKDKLIELYRKDPKLFKAAGIALLIGIIVLGATMGIDTTAGIPPEILEALKVAGVGGAVAATLAGLYKFRNTRSIKWTKGMVVGGVKGGLKLSVFGPLALGAMCASYAMKGENWDKGIEWITGVKVHGWVKSVPEKGK